MAKAIKPLMIVAAIAVNVIPGVGQVLSATMITAITGAGISAALGLAAGALGLGPKAPKISSSQFDRLQANVDPTTPRKIIFGNTAMGVDIRHQEWAAVSSNPQGVLHRIFFHASHAVHSIDEVWLEDRMAWSKTGGVNSFYIDSSGSHQATYFGVTVREEGNAGNTIAVNGGAKWGSTRRATGLAYSHMFFRVIGANVKDKPMESPFSGGPPSRMTVRGRGALVYDPRQDTTAGGSGTMRANDQSTWAYTTAGNDIGRNPALQILWYLLGWKINGKLALGRGIPPTRINMASFIAAANACDETVTSSINGTEPRYRSDGAFSEGDDPNMVLDTLKAACNGEIRDFGGILSLHIRKNDLATVSVQLSEDDILGGFVWKQTPDLDETFNEVRGRFTDPSNLSLYQLRDYPAVRIEPPDGIERSDPFDLPTVQSISQAQRLAKGRLARNLYRGTFAADFNARAWSAGVGKIVELSVAPLGWANKKFRVLEMGVRVDGVVPMLLQEEHADVYLWDNSDVPGVQPFAPTTYDPSLAPVRTIIDTLVAGATRNVWRGQWAPDTLYLVGDLVMVGDVVYETITEHTSVTGSPPPNANFVLWFTTGATSGLSATLTRPEIVLPSSYDGIVDSYANANGEWQIMAGSTNVTAQFLPIVTIDNDATLDVTYAGATYSVTGGFDNALDEAELVMQVNGTGSYVGITFERSFRLTKVRGPLGGDTTPPAQPTGLALTSSIAIDSAGVAQATLTATWNANTEPDLAMYQLSVRAVGGGFVDFLVGGATPQWSSRATIGTTYEAQLRAIDKTGNKSTAAPGGAAVVSHQVGADAVAPAAPTGLTVTAAYQTAFLSWTNPTALDLARVEVYENTVNNSATATLIGTVNAVSALPGMFTRGTLATNTQYYYWLKAVDASNNKSGFSTGANATTGYVPAASISGQLVDAQVAALAASKVTGQLTDSQLAAIAAAKITGQLATGQIADAAVTIAKFAAGIKPVEILGALPGTGNFAGRMVFLTTNNKLYRHTGSPTDATGFVASVAAADVTGQLTDAQLAGIAAAKLTGQITSTQITDDAITTPKLAAGAVTAAEIAANTITAAEIAANAITASELNAGAVTTAKLAAGAVTANEIAADTITSGQIAAGAISASELAAGAVVAGKIAAGAIVAADIAADTITAAQIAANAITSTELSAGSVIAAKIAAGQIQTGHLVAGAVTASKLVIASAENIIPDDMNDLTWWAGNQAPAIVEGFGTGWATPRGIRIDTPGAYYHMTPGFPAEVGATYKIVFDCYISAGFNGWFKPTIHMPNVAWFNLKDGFNTDVPDSNADGRAFTSNAQTVVGGTWTFTNPTGVTNNVNTQWQIRFQGSWTAGYVVFGIRIVRVSDATLIKDGAITTAKITAGAITADKILAGTITGDKFNTGTNLPGTITVGATGVTIETVRSTASTANSTANTANSTANTANSTANQAYTWASDPFTRGNTLSTQIAPGLINISGATTLLDWRFGSDTTKIWGGAIAANTISANKLTIGNRGISVVGIEFQVNAAQNQLTWANGHVFYMDDAGNQVAPAVAAGAINWSDGGGNWIYVYWPKGATQLYATTDFGTARSDPNNIIFCTWAGGIRYVANYGGTIVHGENIVTGTINANRIVANSIGAGQLTTGELISTSSQLGNATVTTLKIAGSSVIVPTVTEGSDTAVTAGGSDEYIMETGWVTVGDGVYGSALVDMQGSWDGTGVLDAYCRMGLQLDVGGGLWEVANVAAGCRVSNGNAYPYIPFRAAFIISGVASIKARMVARSVIMGGASSLKSSVIRIPKIIIQGGKR